MADVTNTQAVWNAETTVTENAGAASQTIVWGTDDKIAILIDNTSDATNILTATISAGTGINSGIGDLTVSVATSAVDVVCLESSRFLDESTGKVTVALATDGTVTNSKLTVIQLP